MTMTTKELSEFFGKSISTITRHAAKCGIEIINGIEKKFSKDEVEKISISLYDSVPGWVKNSISNTFANEKVDTFANEKVDTKNINYQNNNIFTVLNIAIQNLNERIIKLENNQKQLPEPAPKLSENEKIINGWLEYCQKTDIIVIDKTNSKLRIRRPDLWYLYTSVGGNIGQHEFYRLIDKKFRLLKSNGYDYYTGIGVQ